MGVVNDLEAIDSQMGNMQHEATNPKPKPTMMSKASDFAEKALKTGCRALEAATVLKK